MKKYNVRILHIISGLLTGGAEKSLFNLLKGGLSDFCCNYVVSLTGEGTVGSQIKSLGVSVEVLNMKNVSSIFPASQKLLRIVNHVKPDIIQGWMYHGNIAATLIKILSSNPSFLVWNIRHCLYKLGHEKTITQLVIFANRFFSSQPDALLYNSKISKKLHEEFGFSSSNGNVIHNGFDVKTFFPLCGVRNRIRSELGIPDDAFVVGHVARFDPLKDHKTFFSAASNIAKRYSKVYFLVVGREVEFSNKQLMSYIPASLQSRFYLLGDRGDVPCLLKGMDLLCQSSCSEAFPNVLGEAMASGVPCVATNVGDSSIIIGDTGILVPPRDDLALFSGIEKFLTMSVKDYCILSKLARVRIERNFSLTKTVCNYFTLYEKLLSKRKNIMGKDDFFC